MPSVAEIQQLPVLYRVTVQTEHLDAMGHMNVRWYLTFFDEGGWKYYESMGMTLEYYQQNNAGGFALRQVINYLAEVRLGETITIHCRLLGRTEKKIHSMYFMVNETTGKLAATMEGLGAHADLSIRRTAPYPPIILANIDKILAEHNSLSWQVETSGAIHIQSSQ